MSTRPRVRIGALDIDVITFDGALRAIDDLVASNNGGVVFTPNVDHVMLAEKNAQLRDAYSRVNLSLADGMPIVWASHLLRPPVPEKVSGSDLLGPLMDLAAQRQWRVYLLGGADDVAERAAELLRTRGVNIVGVDNPHIALVPSPSDAEIVARIDAAKPHLLLIALGCPKQELFADRTRSQLKSVVSVGVGASFDFLVGRVRRSPAWMSRVGLEWLYRLAKEPGRLWRRYLIQDSQFVFTVARTLVSRNRAADARLSPAVDHTVD